MVVMPHLGLQSHLALARFHINPSRLQSFIMLWISSDLVESDLMLVKPIFKGTFCRVAGDGKMRA